MAKKTRYYCLLQYRKEDNQEPKLFKSILLGYPKDLIHELAIASQTHEFAQQRFIATVIKDYFPDTDHVDIIEIDHVVVAINPNTSKE